jgi:hypothetical protein
MRFKFENILLIIFLVAVLVPTIIYFLIDYYDVVVLLSYKICGISDKLMPFKDENRTIHEYFCHSV